MWVAMHAFCILVFACLLACLLALCHMLSLRLMHFASRVILIYVWLCDFVCNAWFGLVSFWHNGVSTVPTQNASYFQVQIIY
jgi:hypothetical protein